MNVKVHSLLSEKAFARKNGHLWSRLYSAAILGGNLAVRLVLICKRTDIVIVHREVFPFFTPLFERIAIKNAAISVLDIDDAIYANPTHSKDWRRHLRNPVQAKRFSLLFDLILCGNNELVEQFSNGIAQATFAPTCPPIEVHKITKSVTEGAVVTWIGSQSTLGSLREVLPDVLRACEEAGAQLVVLGGENVTELPVHPRLTVARWSPEREFDLLSNASVGLMPLPDTEWERGKSGYKAILYLVAGLHAVVSPIGVNLELTKKYHNAIACGEGEWYEKVRDLLTSINSGGLVGQSPIETRDFYNPETNSVRSVDLIMDLLSAL